MTLYYTRVLSARTRTITSCRQHDLCSEEQGALLPNLCTMIKSWNLNIAVKHVKCCFLAEHVVNWNLSADWERVLWKQLQETAWADRLRLKARCRWWWSSLGLMGEVPIYFGDMVGLLFLTTFQYVYGYESCLDPWNMRGSDSSFWQKHYQPVRDWPCLQPCFSSNGSMLQDQSLITWVPTWP